MKNKLDNLEKYLVDYMGFISIKPDFIDENSTIEFEYHLINREYNIRLDIEKKKNEDDFESTLSGRPENASQIIPYMQYFLYKDEIEITPELKEIFDSIEADLQKTKKEN